ncbi:CAP domain-containing protein [Egicoccus sp. AB-alg6-2]|uniref:CAP domain-containing protein n=1 Tax=Egicoccus sp. AB-alg6-2 TaxID=3242692 RepID=UPI00359E7269
MPAGARRYLPLMVVVLGLWFAGDALPAPSDPPDPITLARQSEQLGWSQPADNAAMAMDVFNRVNDERAARDLPPLVWHHGLATLAGNWSVTMIEEVYEHSPERYLAHPDFIAAGENIAMGQRDTAELHVGWMESDGHRANILLPEFTAMGVGIVCRADGRMWATQVFGVGRGAAVSAEPAMPPAEPIVRRDGGIACPRTERLFPFG